MALHAQFRALGWLELLKAQNGPRLSTPRLQMAAGRAVALLARLTAMHVVLKRLHIRFVARCANLVIIDILGIGQCRDGHPQRVELCRSKERLGLVTVWLQIVAFAASSLSPAVAARHADGERSENEQRLPARESDSGIGITIVHRKSAPHLEGTVHW